MDLNQGLPKRLVSIIQKIHNSNTAQSHRIQTGDLLTVLCSILAHRIQTGDLQTVLCSILAIILQTVMFRALESPLYYWNETIIKWILLCICSTFSILFANCELQIEGHCNYHQHKNSKMGKRPWKTQGLLEKI